MCYTCRLNIYRISGGVRVIWTVLSSMFTNEVDLGDRSTGQLGGFTQRETEGEEGLWIMHGLSVYGRV